MDHQETEFNEIELGILFDIDDQLRVNYIKKLIQVHKEEIQGYKIHNQNIYSLIDDLSLPFKNNQNNPPTLMPSVSNLKNDKNKHNHTSNCYTGMQCQI